MTGQKHTKKDYEKLKNMGVMEVMALTKEEKRIKKFEDPSLIEGIVKVEKKKNFKRLPKGE